MNTPSSPATARIVPNYRAIVRNFEKPMQHGDGRRFLTNPAIYGRSEPGEVFGNVVCANGNYYVAGPGFTGREYDLQTAAIAGNVTHFNRRHDAPAQQVYPRASPEEAHAQLWALVVEHYGITDAAEQIAQVQADKQWEQSPEGQAAQAKAQAWLQAYMPATTEQPEQLEQPTAVPTSAEAAAPAATPAAEPVQFSEAMQLIIGSQAATVQDVAQQMKTGPRKAAQLLKEMRELYGPTPTLINLALFSGAADLMEMITALRKATTPAA